MTHVATSLKPIDFFPLMSFFKKQGVSPFPRFAKPTAQCMNCYSAVKIGNNIVAAAGAFPIELENEGKNIKALYIGDFSAISESGEFIEPLFQRLRETLCKTDADVLVCQSPMIAKALGINHECCENAYTISCRSIGITNQSIEKVFAFVELSVIMDHDLEQLEKVYATGVHYKIPTPDFRLALTAHESKPIAVKDSMGNVTALLLTAGNGIIRELHAFNNSDISPILRAYMIFQRLDTLTVCSVAQNASLCAALEHISEGFAKNKSLFYTSENVTDRDFSEFLPKPL